jgi:Tol biopolymer transport system component
MHPHARRAVVSLASLATLPLGGTGLWAAAPVFPAGTVTVRADITHDGSTPDANSRRPSLSADGNRVAFVSQASNLVPDDTNGVADVFVHDFNGGSTVRVSLATDGTQGHDTSGGPQLVNWATVAISADGGSVAFESDATNLVENDTNGVADVFVRDLGTGTTTRVSVTGAGTEADGASRSVCISNDGRYVGFISLATTLATDAPASGFYVHDRQTGETELASIAYDGTPVSAELRAGLSGDGRHIAFESSEPEIVPGDTNGEYDVFERNLVTGTTERVSVTSSGEQLVGNDPEEFAPNGPALSFTGRYVAFASLATNLPFPNDGNDGTDIFVHDRRTGATVQADVSFQGFGGPDSSSPVISDDGRFVGFHSFAYWLAPCGTNEHGTGFASYYVRDMVAESTVRVSTYADGAAAWPGSTGTRMDLSADGGVAAFATEVPLEPGDTDEIVNVYVHDVGAPVGAPDGAIARASGPAAGTDVCRSSPLFQTKGARVARGDTVTFELTFQNLSPWPDVLTLHGDGGEPGFTVRYFRGTHDVTEAMLVGSRRTRMLERGDTATYTLKIRVLAGATADGVLRVLIRSSSTLQPAVADVVRAKVRVSS